MVLAAVREDRMPGGRNSGAVYNLYKVKYKKHKKGHKNGQIRHVEQTKNSNNYNSDGTSLSNSFILKAALTTPQNNLLRRYSLESWDTLKERMTPEQAMVFISQLIECDDLEDIATLKDVAELREANTEISDKICQIGDTIVYKLVQWTKRLPFYLELPVTVHTQLLTHKWHELLVLSTSAYWAIHPNNKNRSTTNGGTNNNNNNNGSDGDTATNGGVNHNTSHSNEIDVEQEIGNGLCTLHSVLGAMMEGAISLEQLRMEAGHLIEQLTQLTATFRKLKLCLEEYVCLKVVAMLNRDNYDGVEDIESIQDRYLTALRVFVKNRFPQQSQRFYELLCRLPEIQSAGELMLHSKMFYVPFLLNSNAGR